ncbi:MAG TPA: non-homologous end-joining DNA ligase [Pseudonocardiaceae bacterium]|jgi:DNA ligase D-like protein (predicted ligase)|nr:non-homologous end-joining DNA ligase [Pseudonocardiaceae bacterium]
MELVRPMLPVAGPLPTQPGWAFEFSWDGIRALACAQPTGTELFSVRQRDITAAYPELGAFTAGRRMLLDGKIVALDSCGRPSFSQLQRRMNVQRPTSLVVRRAPVTYYVFDLLSLDGQSTAELPYRRRRELLAELELSDGSVVAPPCFLSTDGQTVLDTAAQHGLHAVIAKRVESTYQPGRSRHWVQTTLRQTQEVIIGGWLPERRRAASIGALLVGVPTEGGLRYVGQVGTGFTEATRRDLRDRLAGLAAPASPFTDPVPSEVDRMVHWVAPRLLGEVSYRQWTAHGRLGHPTWRGLRPAKHVAAIQAPVVVRARDSGPDREDQRLLAELDRAVAQVRAELRTLRDQISPHFLHNTISTIVAMVSTDPTRARDLLIIFAEFARYSLRSATETTLAEELENIDRYLTLQRTRFGQRLRVRLEVAPIVLPAVLPFLALQQLVDNAVRNGVECQQLGGTVTITARRDGGDCVITVIDDGPGIVDADVAARLRTIDDQLRDRFGQRYRVLSDAAPGVGTTITLRVPVSHLAGE